MTHVPSSQGFRFSSQRYGVLAGLCDLGYRLLRKTTAFSIHQIFALPCAQLAYRNSSELDCRFLTAEEIHQFSKYPVYDLDSSMHQRILAGQDICYAMLLNGIPVSYSWFALDSIDAQHTPGLDLYFPKNVAYFYKTYTLPEYRGKGLSQNVLISAIETMKQHNYEYIFGFIEVVNRPSKSSCSKIGFQSIGLTLSAFNSRTRILRGANRLHDMGVCFGKSAKINSRQDVELPECP